MRIEKLASARANLRDLQLGLPESFTRGMLSAAIEGIVPDMLLVTIRWMVPMLRDLAGRASCAGNFDLAEGLYGSAYVLDAVLSEEADYDG